MIIECQGNPVYYYTGGESHQADRSAIVFIHGAGMDHTVWTLYARYWAKAGLNVVAPDLPGHGLSGGSALPAIEQYADFVCDLIGELKLTNEITVVGHSMGSLVALECVSRLQAREHKVARLLMLGTSVPMRVGEALLNAARENSQSAIDMISLFGHSFAAQIGNNPVAGISVQLAAERLLEKAAEGVLHNDLNACNEYTTGLDTAAGLDCPVGLILAKQDQMTPYKLGNKLKDVFKHAKEIALDDCGHMLVSEQPEASHRAMCQLMAELS